MATLSPMSWAALLAWVFILTAVVLWAQTFRKRERNLMGHMNTMFAISGVVVAIAIGGLVTRGLNYGLDFTGGTILEIGAYQPVNVDQVQQALADFTTPALGDKMVQVGAEQTTGPDGRAYQKVLVRVTRAEPTSDGGKELRDQEPQALYTHLAGKLGEITLLRTASIGPTITGELRSNAITAIVVALALQCLYIFFRFGNQMRYGVAADLAIVHDLVIMIGLYAISGRQLDSPFVAALLTVAGYSVMDSVVIFDRIRENVQLNRSKPFIDVVNDSVNQTMTRSINTVLTVVITLLSIYFFGGSTLQNFAFALLAGVVPGAYSSICVAPPILIAIDRWAAARKVDGGHVEVLTDSAGSGDSEAQPGAEGGRRRRGRGMRKKA